MASGRTMTSGLCSRAAWRTRSSQRRRFQSISPRRRAGWMAAIFTVRPTASMTRSFLWLTVPTLAGRALGRTHPTDQIPARFLHLSARELWDGTAGVSEVSRRQRALPGADLQPFFFKQKTEYDI